MPPKKGRTTDPLPKRKASPKKPLQSAPNPLETGKAASRKRKPRDEDEDAPRQKKAPKKQDIPASTAEEEEEEEPEEAGPNNTTRRNNRNVREASYGDEHGEEEDFPDQNHLGVVSSSPGGTQWMEEKIEALKVQVRATVKSKAPSKNDEMFDHYMQDFEELYAGVEDELADSSRGDNTKTRSEVIVETLDGILRQVQEDDSLNRFNTAFRARSTAIFSIQDPYESFFKAHKPLIETLKDGAKTCEQRAYSVQGSLSKFERRQRELIEQQQEKAKVNMDAKGLIRGARKFLRSARG